MLFDRPTLRADYPRERTSALTWLVAAICGAFILELLLFSSWFRATDQIVRGIAVTSAGISSGHIWTLATYWLLHSRENLLHLGVVLGGLYLLGRSLESLVGVRRVVQIFGFSIVLGALCWTAVHWGRDDVLLGSSAGVYGLLTVYAALQPNRQVNFLLLFFFPVSLRPKHLALGLLAFEFCAFAFFEARGNKLPFAYAPSAHLGGMTAGWIFFRIIFAERNYHHTANKFAETSRAPLAGTQADEPVMVESLSDSERRTQLKIKVDRILDKINSHGFSSLTASERHILDEAKESLNRH